VSSKSLIFHQELDNEDGNLEDKYCSQIKASCHINGHVIITAITSGEQKNHMMPHDKTHGAENV
jgi:hypothetical protein